jgi:ElaB/YqjD/DUF883 family membrane-anchored ribosome-binding protein
MSERSEREIRDSIEATRARMGDTIEQIGERVNPERVKAELKARARDQIHEVKDNVKRKARNTMRDVEHGVSDTGRSIWATIRENPVPAGMVGVGLAWLIANRRDAGEHRHGEYGTYSTGPAVPYRPGIAGEVTGSHGTSGGTGGMDRGYTDRPDARSAGFAAAAGTSQSRDEDRSQESEGIREKASDVLHEAGERIGEAQERVGDAVHETRQRVGEAMHETRDRVSNWTHEAKYRAQRAEHRIEESMRENPVAAGAVALAIGVAAGLLIPESEREHEVMGRTRDRALDKARDAVGRTADRLHDSARDAAAETARNAVDEVWPGGDDRQNEGFSEPRR